MKDMYSVNQYLHLKPFSDMQFITWWHGSPGFNISMMCVLCSGSDSSDSSSYARQLKLKLKPQSHDRAGRQLKRKRSVSPTTTSRWTNPCPPFYLHVQIWFYFFNKQLKGNSSDLVNKCGGRCCDCLFLKNAGSLMIQRDVIVWSNLPAW